MNSTHTLPILREKCGSIRCNLDHLANLMHIGTSSFEKVAKLIFGNMTLPLARCAYPQSTVKECKTWMCIKWISRKRGNLGVCGKSNGYWTMSTLRGVGYRSVIRRFFLLSRLYCVLGIDRVDVKAVIKLPDIGGGDVGGIVN